ncbi:MAG: hypothetical protein IKM76_07035 [Prevotella sp.]|nr:hypothetical protein [Prevotella sp.]
MKEIKNHIIALMAAVLLAACSDDSNELVPDTPEQAEEEKGLAMDLSASAPDFVNAAEPEEMARETLRGTSEAITRSWTPPSGYFLYSEFNDDHGNTYQNFASNDLTRKSINVFFTRATGDEPTPVAPEDPTYPRYANYPYHGRLSYKSSTEKWQLSIRKVKPELVLAGDYYVYGFTPSAAADDAVIERLPEPDGDFKNGAKLTIKGLRTAGYDACVIIGAKEGPDIDHDNGLVAGDFKFDLKTGESVKNYLYLLFDHLGSALSISIKVDGTYNTLRTIKLKQLALQTATNDGMVKEKVDAVVDLTANALGTNPITSLSINGGLDPTDPDPPVGDGATVYHSDDGLTLTTDYQSLLSHFLPFAEVTKVVVTCTYDIYDKKGNLIRKDSKATNTVRLSDIIAYFPGVERGWKYGINMTVVPTYLYMLSEPDLENPRMVVN